MSNLPPGVTQAMLDRRHGDSHHPRCESHPDSDWQPDADAVIEAANAVYQSSFRFVPSASPMVGARELANLERALRVPCTCDQIAEDERSMNDDRLYEEARDRGFV